MKRTTEDDAFAIDFGRALSRHYEEVRKANGENPLLTDEQFASTLDVSRAALKKYLRGGAMPALRVVVLAFLRYGINVKYSGTPLFGKKVRKNSSNAGSTQLILPFSVQAFNASSIQTKIEPKGENGYELCVSIQRTG